MKKYLAVGLINTNMQVVFWNEDWKKDRSPHNKQVSLAVKPPNWYGQQGLITPLLP
jgi:hypothetical protein